MQANRAQKDWFTIVFSEANSLCTHSGTIRISSTCIIKVLSRVVWQIQQKLNIFLLGLRIFHQYSVKRLGAHKSEADDLELTKSNQYINSKYYKYYK